MNSQPLENKEQSSALSLVTLDLAEVYSLVRAREAQRALPPPAPDLRLHKVGRPAEELTLNRTSTVPLLLQLLRSQEATLPARMLKLQATGHQPLAVKLRQLNPKTYRVLMAPPHGGHQQLEFDIPSGLPRFINVATLKAMVGADSFDVMFRKAAGGERWAVCPDDYPVDLEDRTQVFKIREWAILS